MIPSTLALLAASPRPGGHRTQDRLRGQRQRPEATHGTEGAAAGVGRGWS